MSTHNTFRWTRLTAAVAMALGFTLPQVIATDAAAQASDLAGIGQKPYVLIVQDTSASMELGTQGDTFSCHRQEAGKSCAGSTQVSSGTYNGQSYKVAFDWRPGSTLTTTGDTGIDGKSGSDDRCNADGTPPQGKTGRCEPIDYPDKTYDYVGPCVVWAPKCDKYERPFWHGQVGYGNGDQGWNNDNESSMQSRFDLMRGQVGKGIPVRLTEGNQPRHVMIKEILTGEMILRPNGAAAGSSYSYKDYGPGCWFVPRQRGSGSYPDVQNMCYGENKFEEFVDHRDPRPHMQEVFDYQLATGLMDNLSNAMIFAVAMFDGRGGKYNAADPSKPVDHTYGENKDRNLGLNDAITSSSIYEQKETGDDESGQFYNLGIYRVIGPSVLDLPSSMLPGVSTLAQLALVDAGFLQRTRNDDGDVKYKRDSGDIKQKINEWSLVPGADKDNNFNKTASDDLGLSLPDGLEKYMEGHQLGKQPVAYATPLAAAIYDVHSFFKGSQKIVKPDGRGDNSHEFSPIQDDPYKDCRAKHVVMITDGFPRPERAANGNDIGAEALLPSYYPDSANLYKYSAAEEEIGRFITDINGPGTTTEPRYRTRVHVVAVNALPPKGITAEDDALRGKALRKLGDMAREGETCALYYLIQGDGKRFVPKNITLTIGGVAHTGTCDAAAGDNCLVMEQSQSGYMFPKHGDVTAEIDCTAPALILDKNQTSSSGNFGNTNLDTTGTDLTIALQLIFNKILEADSDVASRTRASVTSYLDAENFKGQYRIYSGSEVGGGLYWKGLLNRQELICGVAAKADDQAGNNPAQLHVDIANQVEKIPGQSETAARDGFKDNRRIFTGVPRLDNHSLGGGKNEKRFPTTSDTSNTIFMSYRLFKSNRDEFGPSYLFQNLKAEGTRVPLRPISLLEAFGNDPNQVSPAFLSVNDIDAFISTFKVDSADTTPDSRKAMESILGSVNTGLDFRRTISDIRGRKDEKLGRTLGGILNSNPVTVGPPELDVPIDSYREFKARYANRPTMLYVATLDGLLHAIHTGINSGAKEIRVRNRVDLDEASSISESQDATISLGEDLTQIPSRPDYNPSNPYSSQREAWAYAPRILMHKYASNRNRQPNLMDGTPTVADVRLCNRKQQYNHNAQACDTSTSTEVKGYDQWRTVLVQGLGQSGPGYFALDVTRSGGQLDSEDGNTSEVKPPDPITLWEIDPTWEEIQIRSLRAADPTNYLKRIGPESSSLRLDLSDGCSGSTETTASDLGFNNLEEMSFMGLSVGDAAVGEVSLDLGSGGSPEVTRRPVAVFSAGISGAETGGESSCGAQLRVGRAIYIVDLQTGSILRRFVSYFDTTGTETRFDTEVLGSPALFDSTPGSLVTRGFVGDRRGRMYRINLNSSDPLEWRVELMYDPDTDASLRAKIDGIYGTSPSLGPAAFRPAVALDDNRNLTVIYGLGERTDLSTAGQAQAVIALRETFKSSGGVTGDLETDKGQIVLWHRALAEREKLTGEPIVYNGDVYFTTYISQVGDLCEPGTSRIYGLELAGTPDPNDDLEQGAVVIDTTKFGTGGSGGGILYEIDNNAPDPGPDTKLAFWLGPDQPTVIRGVAVTLGPVCNDDTFQAGGASAEAFDKPQRKPQLIAQTGGADPTSSSDFARGGGMNSTDRISRFVVDLPAPKTSFDMLSWTIISN